MEFTKDILKIDPEVVAGRLEVFIRDRLKNFFHRRGIVIGLSGGIDSAVAGSLAVRAIGKERVFGLLLPERDSSPLSRKLGKLRAESLGIEYAETDITPMLESFGVYSKREAIVKKYFPDIQGDYKFRLSLPQDLIERDRLNVYYLEVKTDGDEVKKARLSHEDYLEMMAANDIKQRTRMIQLYYEAERRHYIVLGTTNRSEAVQGFFVKYGDGGVDLEPLSILYKAQVYQLGKYLGVPEEILSRTPSPDTYSFEVSDKDFYFCLPYDQVDLILYAMEHDIDKGKVAEVLGLELEQLERAWNDYERKFKATEHLRQMPPVPEEL